MKKTKQIFSGVMILALILVLAGCGSSKNEKVFKVTTSEIEGLDISLATFSQTFDVMAAIYEPLFLPNNEGELVPAGASELPTISSDNLTYTIKLREDAKWTDSTGAEKRGVTAEDYVYSWKRTINPETKSSYGYIFAPIAGYEEASKGEIDKLAVKAVDDHTLEIKLKEPAPFFTELLAFAVYAPIAKEMVEENGTAYGQSNSSVWYNGAFYVTSYDKASSINTVKNENYWDKELVQLDGVNFITTTDDSTAFASFQSGAVDLSKIPSPEQFKVAEKDMKDSIQYKDEAGNMVFYLNTQDGPFKNVNLRKAVSMAIDNESIANNIYGAGTKAINTFIPGSLTKSSYGVNFTDYTGELKSFNVEEAKKHLALAEKELGLSASEIKIDLLVAENDVNKTLAELTASQLKNNLGITVNIKIQPSTAYIESKNVGAFDMIYSGWSADYGDASNFLYLFKSELIGGQNTPRYNNSEYDKAFDQANLIADEKSRNEAFAKLETQIVKDEAILVPIINRGKDILVNPRFKYVTHPIYKTAYKFVEIK